MEIVPGVHMVRLLGSSGYVVAEDRLTLVDAGLRGSHLILRRELARMGRSVGEIARIVCTHGHPDHVGGVHELVREAPAEVFMHPADHERLRVSLREVIERPGRGPIFAYLTKSPEAVRPLEDGDELPVLGGLRVIHTPGHTPGSISLYAPMRRLLFVGDVLQVVHGRLALPSSFFSEDLALAHRSIARLAELDVEAILFSHFPPWVEDANGALAVLAKAS